MVRTGRPRKDVQGVRVNVVSCRVTEEEYRWLQSQSFTSGQSIADLVRARVLAGMVSPAASVPRKTR